ncbi:MAG: hypothetical protein KJ600_03895 [Nanoarchaeota archaeon]|nr:hypothetical protein [Nanoarchaeota archaeon]MBU1103670.1 hypothetical protein [Nanoarchaeota archaeon]
MKLVAFVGNDTENLGQLTALINRMDCDKVLLVKDKKTSNPFQNPKCVPISVDSAKDLISFKQEIQEKLKKELSGDMEVALSIASGSGKEHMALISALLSIPVGIKLAAFTKTGVEFIS